MAALEAALTAVRTRIVAACERSGRDPGDIRVVGVTKQVAPKVIEAAAAAGLREFGENYVKDLEIKRPAAPDAVWHFVGRLQRNKVPRVLRAADVVQTLEPGRSTGKLLELAEDEETRRDCLIEVDFTGERVGAPPEELGPFADTVISAGVPLRGLMTVAPPETDPRPWFAKLRELRDRLRDRHEGIKELSMGMSTDLEVAVEEGATMVRVGTAIFGLRRR
ncbi:MAG: YggS family pyridoxal phosphate-dependent enzyme [Actinomycetota bacterium]